jgi:hypothetical protein
VNQFNDAARGGHFHAVQFYKDEMSLCAIVASFLVEGFANGDPAVVIATPEHRLALEDRLRHLSVDVDSVKRAGDLVIADASQILASVMRNGMPDAAMFRVAVGSLIEQVCRGRTSCTVRAFGEMVDLLWKDGLEAAAIRLETLWNELANTHDFKLLCGYSMGNFYKGAAIEEIKGQHTHVFAESRESSTIN